MELLGSDLYLIKKICGLKLVGLSLIVKCFKLIFKLCDYLSSDLKLRYGKTPCLIRLVDLFSDLLVSNGNGDFVDPWTIDGASGDFVNLADGLNEAVNGNKEEPLFAPTVVFEEKE